MAGLLALLAVADVAMAVVTRALNEPESTAMAGWKGSISASASPRSWGWGSMTAAGIIASAGAWRDQMMGSRLPSPSRL